MEKTTNIYKKHILSFIIGPSLKLIEAFFDLLIPLIMKAVIDLKHYPNHEDIPNRISSFIGGILRGFNFNPTTNQALNDAFIGGIIILIMGVVGFVITMISQFMAATTCVKIGSELRDKLYTHILSFSKKERERIGNGRLLTVINSDTYQVQQGVLLIIRLLVRAPFILIGSLIFAYILNVPTGIIFTIIVPIILLIILLMMFRSSKEYTNIQSKVDTISTNVSDTLEGNKVIHAFSKKEYESKKFDINNKAYQEKASFAAKITALANPLTYAVISLATVMVVLFAGIPMFESADPTLYASTIITEIAYLGQILFVLVQLSKVILQLTKSNVSRHRIDDVFMVTPSIKDDEEGLIKEINNGEELYSFNNVSMRYEEKGNNTISNVSFNIYQGETIGIIGGIGSGKSTLISLMNRLNDVDEGELKYKGIRIDKYRLKRLRDEVGVVSQKATLFNGTIRSNLLIGKKDATEEEMIDALKLSDAYEFVSKYDDGLDHEVVDFGKNYSGGQRQRLSIARVLLKKPKVIILDDATSALDLLTEKRVRNNINEAFKDATKIIISQRISSIMMCKMIYLFDKGRIIASGSHEELLHTSKVYLEIFESQLLKEVNK